MFTIMTWNVENLYRPGGAYGPESDQAYETKLKGLADVIGTVAPDVVALQEVGDEEALSDLIDVLPDGSDWDRAVSNSPDSRGIRVAWLSRSPLRSPLDIVEFPDAWPPVQVADGGAPTSVMGRGALAVTAETSSGLGVQLVNAHLKSKLLTFPGPRFDPQDENERARYTGYALNRRAAEAATVRTYATDVLQRQGETCPLIVCGDLNDTPQAATTQLLLGPPGSEIGTNAFERPDQGDAERLWNLAPLMPAGQDYSRSYQGRRELIDHVLVSAALVRAVGSIRAVTPNTLDDVTDDPTVRRDADVSDHAPIVAVFDDV